MSYDLKPHNPELEWFHMGAFSFPVILDACNYLFPCIHHGAQWYCVFGADPRMPEGDTYPKLLSNDGFPVTEEEARIMARMVRNYCKVQRSLPEDQKPPEDVRGKAEFKREDVARMLM